MEKERQEMRACHRERERERERHELQFNLNGYIFYVHLQARFPLHALIPFRILLIRQVSIFGSRLLQENEKFCILYKANSRLFCTCT
jgi:hypothetical protein